MPLPAGEDTAEAVALGDGVVAGGDVGAVGGALGLPVDVAHAPAASMETRTRDRTFVRWLEGFTLAMLAGIP